MAKKKRRSKKSVSVSKHAVERAEERAGMGKGTLERSLNAAYREQLKTGIPVANGQLQLHLDGRRHGLDKDLVIPLVPEPGGRYKAATVLYDEGVKTVRVDCEPVVGRKYTEQKKMVLDAFDRWYEMGVTEFTILDLSMMSKAKAQVVSETVEGLIAKGWASKGENGLYRVCEIRPEEPEEQVNQSPFEAVSMVVNDPFKSVSWAPTESIRKSGYATRNKDIPLLSVSHQRANKRVSFRLNIAASTIYRVLPSDKFTLGIGKDVIILGIAGEDEDGFTIGYEKASTGVKKYRTEIALIRAKKELEDWPECFVGEVEFMRSGDKKGWVLLRKNITEKTLRTRKKQEGADVG